MAVNKRKKPPRSRVVEEPVVYAKTDEKLGVELKLTHGVSMCINTGNSQNQGARPYQEDSFGYSNIIACNIV